MRIKELLSIGLLATFGLGEIASVASAEVKFVKYGQNNDIIATGFTPGYGSFVRYSGVSKEKEALANSCGYLSITASTGGTIAVNSQTYNVSDIPTTTQSSWPCTGSSADPLTSPKKLVLAKPYPNAIQNYKVLIPGFTSGIRYKATVTGLADKKTKADACGMVKLNNSGAYTNKSFTLEAGSNPIVPIAVGAAPQCKNGVALYPLGYTP